MEIEKTPTRTTSRLFLTRATKRDSGNYTCAPTEAQPGTVLVHVVRGEGAEWEGLTGEMGGRDEG